MHRHLDIKTIKHHNFERQNLISLCKMLGATNKCLPGDFANTNQMLFVTTSKTNTIISSFPFTDHKGMLVATSTYQEVDPLEILQALMHNSELRYIDIVEQILQEHNIIKQISWTKVYVILPAYRVPTLYKDQLHLLRMILMKYLKQRYPTIVIEDIFAHLQEDSVEIGEIPTQWRTPILSGRKGGTSYCRCGLTIESYTKNRERALNAPDSTNVICDQCSGYTPLSAIKFQFSSSHLKHFLIMLTTK